ncbi:MAG TPA: ABC-F family ATP-binding cassette domain-containing protein [Phycisphaerae bacterium]|nr:ABC-F family ATP-binding cassette domain-containing protein [Phycisphaerae bacterium]HRT41399.1 ABC-F family ATP-binding cassette domain-containing protein [Phycisphaerae bacterium]
MGLIRVQNVTKQFGGQVVLNDVSVEFSTGHVVGLVGPNGAGKTTLFKLITGQLAPDLGTVTLSKGLEVGYLPQEPEVAEGQTLHDEVLSVFADVLALEQKLQGISEQMAAQPAGPALDELMQQYDRTTARFEAAGGYTYEQRLGEILGGLGFSQADYKLPMAALSGGQKCRAALAKLLLQESQFLLLDEPTNHLDIDAVRWLEKFLAGHHGGAVIVSHDRYLLDRLAERIVEVEGARLRSFPGNYTNYVQTKAVRQLTQDRQFVNDRAFIQKEREFIAKHMGKQRTAEAKGRLKRLERRLAAGEFTLERTSQREKIKIRFGEADRQVTAGKDVLSVRGLSKAYGEKRLFTDLSLTVPAGSRLGITGPNGTGKTTLLKIVLGQVRADAGEFDLDVKASVGYYAQEATELDPNRTVVQEILTVRQEWLESHARSYAARFLFRGEDPFKRVSQLSGGEQSRVRLMKIILANPNLLILDEPTNHLDIASREVLEEALLEFPGTIIAVSHDRYFLDRICDHLLVMRSNEHALYGGNYSYYIRQVEAERESAAMAAGAEKRPKAAKGGKTPRGGGQDAAAAVEKPQRTRFHKLRLEELEQLIIDLETRLMELHERFGEPELYHDATGVSELREEFDAVQAELAEAEQEWNARAERE